MRRHAMIVGLLLMAVTAVVYAPSLSSEFLEWDDPLYVTQNPQVRTGLSAQNLLWACTTNHAGNWHPLTWISHMLDCALFGVSAPGHHAVSLLLHCLNSGLLLWLLYAATGRLLRSGFVAALFALHPLHVESVVWVSERKDVLSTLFWLLTMCAYTSWTRKGGRGRYLWTMVLLALGLMAKPMLVSLPLVLVLWDHWPLRRRQLLEKVPLLALSLLSSIVTFAVQRGSMEAAAAVPFASRLANAIVSYWRYIVKMFWPDTLSPFYPHPNLAGGTPWATWEIAGAALLLVVISLAVFRVRRLRYPVVGWLWYLVTLVPVIGLVQVGRQAMADRYTYVPLIGLFIVVSWGAADLLASLEARFRATRIVGAVVGGAVLLACIWATWVQVGYWRDSVTMLRRALACGPPTPVIHGNLGSALASRDELEQAIEHYREALHLDPDYIQAHTGLGDALRDAGRLGQATQHYREAIRIDPDFAPTYNNLGLALLSQERFEEAIERFEQALRVAPGLPGAVRNLSVAEHRLGLRLVLGQSGPRDPAGAAVWLRRAAERGNSRAQFDLAALLESGDGLPPDYGEALTWYRRAAEQGEADAQCNLGVMYVMGKGVAQDDAEAAKWFRMSAAQAYAQCEFNLGRIYFLGRGGEQSDVLAHAWFGLATDDGDAAAGEWRDRCAAGMTAHEIAEARALQVRLRQQQGR